MSTTNLLKLATKRLAQYTVSKIGPHTRKPKDPELLILMYHRILPNDDARTKLEEPGMCVSPGMFAKHLDYVQQYFDFIHISEWLEKRNRGDSLPGRACAISFDDGWADNYEFAYPILKEKAVPATIFLVADMIGTSRNFWPENLAYTIAAIAKHHPTEWNHPSLKWLRGAKTSFQFRNSSPTREELSELIQHAKTYSDKKLKENLHNIESIFNLKHDQSHTPLLNWGQVNEMIESRVIEAGSHTCNHIRLDSNTTEDILHNEVINSKTTIEKQTKRAVHTFCFPNGDYSQASLELVRKNYMGAVTTASGWNSISSDSFMLRRIGIHEEIANTKHSFLSRIAGWL